jgi:hypothetical protein
MVDGVDETALWCRITVVCEDRQHLRTAVVQWNLEAAQGLDSTLAGVASLPARSQCNLAV